MYRKQWLMKWRARRYWSNKKNKKWLEIAVLWVFVVIAALVARNLQKLLYIEQNASKIQKASIDYEAFRDMDLTKEKDFDPGASAVSFFIEGKSKGSLTKKELSSLKKKTASTKQVQELKGYYKALFQDLECFPVRILVGETESVSFENTWRDKRSYGGEREHEGIDMMASNNQRGYFTILSMSDGVVEKMGWNEQGGYRIGIRSKNGLYCYYAHLHSYEPKLSVGSKVSAGAVIGLMGDSGYGKEEGTIGMFDVHLHLGIYMELNGVERSINPYWLLKRLEQ